MLEEGFVDEVKKLRLMGYGSDLKPMRSIGYKQINQFLDGEVSFEEAIEMIKRDTKRLAKRQMTWLRKDKDIHWHRIPEDRDNLINTAIAFFRW
jgi:tRNA dimethylallyltransferase